MLAALDSANVPAGKVYSVEDIARDPQYLAREMIIETPTSNGSVLKVPGIIPKLSATPGRIARPAPRLGEHTQEVVSVRGWPERRNQA